MKKLFKGLAAFCMALMMVCNVSVVHAAESPVASEEPQFSNEEWGSFIDEIIQIKEENPGKSDEEIVAIISASVKARDVESRGISDTWNALTDSEKVLCVKYPLAALKVNEARNIASEQTVRKFGYSGLGDRSDAFRHGMWNAEMTILIGAEKAELFATAHEDKDTTGNESDGYSKEAHKNMDLNNNAVGREIGQNNSNLSEDELADYIYELIYSTDTSFIWLHE